ACAIADIPSRGTISITFSGAFAQSGNRGEDPLPPAGGEGWGEGAFARADADTLTRFASLATLSRGAGEGFKRRAPGLQQRTPRRGGADRDARHADDEFADHRRLPRRHPGLGRARAARSPAVPERHHP